MTFLLFFTQLFFDDYIALYFVQILQLCGAFLLFFVERDRRSIIPRQSSQCTSAGVSFFSDIRESVILVQLALVQWATNCPQPEGSSTLCEPPCSAVFCTLHTIVCSDGLIFHIPFCSTESSFLFRVSSKLLLIFDTVISSVKLK